jgi:hypothetical protein
MTTGLIVFIIVVLADAVALIVDAANVWMGDPTVTSWLRANEPFAVAAVVAQVVAGIGLAWHLWWKT